MQKDEALFSNCAHVRRRGEGTRIFVKITISASFHLKYHLRRHCCLFCFQKQRLSEMEKEIEQKLNSENFEPGEMSPTCEINCKDVTFYVFKVFSIFSFICIMISIYVIQLFESSYVGLFHPLLSKHFFLSTLFGSWCFFRGGAIEGGGHFEGESF